MNTANAIVLLKKILAYFKERGEAANLQNEINDILGVEAAPLEPTLAGYTSRKMGYKGYLPIEEGTPIYELGNLYFIDMINETNGKVFKQKYYKQGFNALRETK